MKKGDFPMTKQELERMISLTDDRYIDEALDQPITLKKRSIRPIMTGAAVAACVGLFIFANITGNDASPLTELTVSSSDTTAKSPLSQIEAELEAEKEIVSEMEQNEEDEEAIQSKLDVISDLEEQKRIEEAALENHRDRSSYLDKIMGINRNEENYRINAPYAKYFSGECEEAFPVLPEAESLTYMPNVYTGKLFDFGCGEDASGLKIYCNEAYSPVYANVMFILGKSSERFTQSALLTITADGSSQLDYSIENCVPQELCGVQIYGFENEDDTTELFAFFRLNGQGYSLAFGNLGYREATAFLELLINSEISLDTFDLSVGSYTTEIK